MGNAEDIRKLGKEIVVAHQERLNAIQRRVKDVNVRLKTEIRSLLDGFTARRSEVTEETRKSASEQKNKLLDFVGALGKDTEKMLTGMKKDHRNMASALRKEHHKCRQGRISAETSRHKDFNTLLGHVRKDLRVIGDSVNQIKLSVKDRLLEFTAERWEVSTDLRKSLTGYVKNLADETKKLVLDARQDREKVARVWREMPARKEALESRMAGKQAPKKTASNHK
jgi:t-SNARE complex subunit (syntaxin)